MKHTERDVQRKLRILRHAEQIGDDCKTCRYFGIARGSFYRWKTALQRHGEAGVANRKPVPRNPANRTPPEIVEKVLHLRRTYLSIPITSSGLAWAARSVSLVRDDRIPDPASPCPGLAIQDAGTTGS